MTIKKILAALVLILGMAATATATAGNCVNDPSICKSGEKCEPATGNCQACLRTAKLRGGGQNPNTVDLQIQSRFTVLNDGCIVDATDSTLTVTPGTKLLVDVNAGHGPQPTSGTWKGVSIPTDTNPITIECPANAGEVGQLILDNKDGGGKDIDRITITVQ